MGLSAETNRGRVPHFALKPLLLKMPVGWPRACLAIV